MQANTPETPAKTKEINLERKPIKLNAVMWGSYRYLKGIAEPGDFIIPMKGSKIDDDTYAVIIKVLKAKDNS